MDFKFVPAPDGAIIDGAFSEENIDNFMQAVVDGRDNLKQGKNLIIEHSQGASSCNVVLEGVYEKGSCYKIFLTPDAGAGAYDNFTSSSLIISEDGVEVIVDGLDGRYPDNRELDESKSNANIVSVNSYDLAQAKSKLGSKIDLSSLKEKEETGLKRFSIKEAKKNDARKNAQEALERSYALTDAVLSNLKIDSKTSPKAM